MNAKIEKMIQDKIARYKSLGYSLVCSQPGISIYQHDESLNLFDEKELRKMYPEPRKHLTVPLSLSIEETRWQQRGWMKIDHDMYEKDGQILTKREIRTLIYPNGYIVVHRCSKSPILLQHGKKINFEIHHRLVLSDGLFVGYVDKSNELKGTGRISVTSVKQNSVVSIIIAL